MLTPPRPAVLPRRTLLGLLGAGSLGLAVTACADRAGTASEKVQPGQSGESMEVLRYGADPSQFGELYRPGSDGVNKPGVVVILHGGFWRAEFDLGLGRPLARDLQEQGYTVWNLEYRRVGNGGGWTGTFDDVHAGIDHLAKLDVDTTVVTAIGHSAGGHLAAWAASRGALPDNSSWASPLVPVTGVVSQAGVLALQDAAEQGLGGSAVVDLIGAASPQRYAVTDPLAMLPTTARIRCVHGDADTLVPLSQSQAYLSRAQDLGMDAELTQFTGGHFELIDPRTKAWAACLTALQEIHA